MTDEPSDMVSSEEEPMLSDRVKECLEVIGGSQAELARQLGVSRSAVGQWLQGNVKDIRSEALFTLARLANVRPEWLALGESPKKPTSKDAPSAINALEGTHEVYAYYVTKEEHELLQAYRHLSPEQQEMLAQNAQFLMSRAQSNIVPVPVKKTK
jgi:transcriptional regulator with XRE-family HTH domain